MSENRPDGDEARARKFAELEAENERLRDLIRQATEAMESDDLTEEEGAERAHTILCVALRVDDNPAR